VSFSALVSVSQGKAGGRRDIAECWWNRQIGTATGSAFGE